MVEIFIQGILLGLSTGVSCIGYCSPLFIPYLLCEKIGFKTNVIKVVEFLSGRLVAYIIWGIAVGTFSNFFSSYGKKISIVAILFSSFLLLAYGIMKNFPNLTFCKRLKNINLVNQFPFFLGISVGINICPPFIMAISYLLNVGKVKESVIFFIFFFLGTSVYMIPFIFINFLSKIYELQNIARVATIISGIWFLIYGISLL
jgi:sulfite exporter TauE/SafE